MKNNKHLVIVTKVSKMVVFLFTTNVAFALPENIARNGNTRTTDDESESVCMRAIVRSQSLVLAELSRMSR